MSCRRSSKRIHTKRRFLITGFTSDQKDEIASAIKRLGGSYIDSPAFDEQCTHLLCAKPSRSEKFLGACATGKWILKRAYIDASLRKGSWLNESDYEWTDSGGEKVKHPSMYQAPIKWRKFVQDSGKMAFDSWRAVIIVDDTNMKAVFRRLLEIGGARAVITRLPGSVDTSITHIFVKSCLDYSYLKPWKKRGVPCLAPDYIGDFLVENPVPPFHARDIFLKAQINKQSEGVSKISGENNMTRRTPTDKPSSVSAVSSICGTPAKISQLDCKKIIIKVENLDCDEVDNTLDTNTKDGNDLELDKNNNQKIIPVKRSQRLSEREEKKMKLNTSSRRVIEHKLSSTENIVSDGDTRKRKSLQDLNSSRIKRPRLYEDFLVSFDQLSPLRHEPSPPVSLPMPECMMEMFNACYEEHLYHKALDLFLCYVCPEKYPPSEMISKMMCMLVYSQDESFSQSVYMALRRLLVVHPPVTLSVQLCYVAAMELDPTETTAWDFLTYIIDSCKDSASEVSATQVRNNHLVLRFLHSVFRLNLLHLEENHPGEKEMPILARILWTPADIGRVNYRVKYLIGVFVDVCSSEEKSELRRIFYNLVDLAFRCSRYCTKEVSLNFGNSDDFISELTTRLLPFMSRPELLNSTLDVIRGHLLAIGICCYALDSLDTSMLVDKYNDISLGKILGHYLFCVPKRCATLGAQITNSEKSKSDKVPYFLSRSAIANINNRNMKGETKLHVACMKGQTMLVRQLLTVSGIDVNIQDYAGWTPLHEACNAGHAECVRLLLNYKAPKTIETYFSPKKRGTAVDLLAVNTEGISPLHDAVMNGRVDVVGVLMSYGGPALLQQTDIHGRTPVDYAVNDEMRAALSSVEDNSGQDSSQLSIESDDLHERYCSTNALDCVSVDECRNFLHIFECLLVSFILVNNLKQSSPSDDNWRYLKKLPRYISKLWRHVNQIVVETGKSMKDFQTMFERLYILAEVHS